MKKRLSYNCQKKIKKIYVLPILNFFLRTITHSFFCIVKNACHNFEQIFQRSFKNVCLLSSVLFGIIVDSLKALAFKKNNAKHFRY